MLNPKAAIPALAELIGITSNQNGNLTRWLSKAEPEGFYWGRFGSGRSGDITVDHMIYNVIGHFCSPGQANNAPKVVAEFNQLRPYQFVTRVPARAPDNALVGPAEFIEEVKSWDKNGEPATPLIEAMRNEVLRRVHLLKSGEDPRTTAWSTFRITVGSHNAPMTAEATTSGFRDYPWSSVTERYRIAGAHTVAKAGVLQPARLQVVIGPAEIAALATLAAKIEGELPLGSNPELPPAKGNDGDAQTKKAAEPASSNGPQSSVQSACRAYAALVQIAPSCEAQSDTEKGRKQQLPESEGDESRVRQVVNPDRSIGYPPSKMRICDYDHSHSHRAAARAT